MSLRRFRRQYKQRSHFERKTISGMMKAGWSVRRVACHQLCHRPPPRYFLGSPWVFSKHIKAPGRSTFRITVHIPCAALDDHPSTPPFGVVPRTSDTPLPQLVGAVSLPTIHGTPSIDLWHHITAQRYVNDILHPHVLPLMQRFPEVIFQQGNVRPHTAKLAKAVAGLGKFTKNDTPATNVCMGANNLCEHSSQSSNIHDWKKTTDLDCQRQRTSPTVHRS
ncbi:hypothetical protein TNCV_3006681 [Trichonephila clavipes]|nr:hypothetical protein TNCV_3006681 [Trichonephila clavipes]